MRNMQHFGKMNEIKDKLKTLMDVDKLSTFIFKIKCLNYGYYARKRGFELRGQ